MGGFPNQDPRPTWDYFGLRRIHAVRVTRHTPCAHCRTWVYPYQGDACHHTTMDPASLSPPAPPGARPLDLMFKGGEVSSPTHPAYPSFQNWHQKAEQSRRTIGTEWCTSHIHAVRSTSTTTPLRSSIILVTSYDIHGW